MQYLQSLSLLEERIQAAVELINYLKGERKKLEAESLRLTEAQRSLERRIELLGSERESLDAQCQQLRAKHDEYQRFERDREEIRSRIDGMLAKFEELEV